MLHNYAHVFWHQSVWLMRAAQGLVFLADEKGEDAPIGEKWSQTLRHNATTAGEACEMVDLDSVAPLVNRMRFMLDPNEPIRVAQRLVDDLNTRIMDQLTMRKFLFVSPKHIPLYEEPLATWGNVGHRFPNTVFDIEEAGKCFALGRHTASVLHLMRVLEVGLKAFGAHVGAEWKEGIHPWDYILNRIRERIDGISDPSRKTDQQRLAGIAAHLRLAKNGWRDPGVHNPVKHDPEAARLIYDGVRAFMRDLAVELAERPFPA